MNSPQFLQTQTALFIIEQPLLRGPPESGLSKTIEKLKQQMIEVETLISKLRNSNILDLQLLESVVKAQLLDSEGLILGEAYAENILKPLRGIFKDIITKNKEQYPPYAERINPKVGFKPESRLI